MRMISWSIRLAEENPALKYGESLPLLSGGSMRAGKPGFLVLLGAVSKLSCPLEAFETEEEAELIFTNHKVNGTYPRKGQ